MSWPVAGLALLVVAAGAVWAGDGTPLAPSGSGAGGDSVGSLPLSAGGPPTGPSRAGPRDGYPGHQMPAGPATPILSLVGTQAELDAVVFDAYGTGSMASFDLGNGLVRYEFYGRVTVELRRAQFQTSFVSAQLVIGSSFQGAKAVIKVDGQFKAKHILNEGVRDLHLHQLVQSGIVDLGLNWHARNLQNVHRVIAIDDVGNLIRIDQRD
jgi:hypothetical protein